MINKEMINYIQRQKMKGLLIMIKLILKVLDNISIRLCITDKIKGDRKIKYLKKVQKLYQKIYYIGA